METAHQMSATAAFESIKNALLPAEEPFMSIQPDVLCLLKWKNHSRSARLKKLKVVMDGDSWSTKVMVAGGGGAEEAAGEAAWEAGA